ncbi:pyruvate kinase-like protein [Dactylonectria macrodidyma]|uniref:Pyruvate kinase-like protein n=1 Tax=Dactylonectria macrodidyma TaxID=307937 RepID=A0A9P9FV33_9HYPO|nr:pyruvate kinase-like protein [Dactylonectria macrodidyma]
MATSSSQSETPAHGVPLPPNDFITSLRLGKVKPFGPTRFRTAINKQPQKGLVQVTDLGLVGDEQSYEFHGGIDKAIHQYCSKHYGVWNEEAPGREHLFKPGGFGENISAAHMHEGNVCVGDKYRLGEEVVLQVSQPRQPCYKLNHRFEYKKASSSSQNSGRTGWYYRVLKPGHVKEGDKIELIERINPSWSLSRVQNFLYHDPDNADALAELSHLPALGTELLGIFSTRLTQGVEDMNGRLVGDMKATAWRSFKLVKKTSLTPRVKKFVFANVDGSMETEDRDFSSFAHVRIKFGPDSRYTRAYSVVSGTFEKFELGVALDGNSRGGSRFLHNDLGVGDIIQAAKGNQGELGRDCLKDERIKKHIFIVGGIGITAFLPEIRTLSRSITEFEVHYAVRSRRDASYLQQLPFQQTTIYAKDEGQRLDPSAVIPGPSNDVTFDIKIYVCGPSSLLDACQSLATKLGYPRSNTHFESFKGPSVENQEAFEVEIKSTSRRIPVPQEKSLLDVLVEAGFDIESSCLVGNCGTCMVQHCGGEVIHNGVALDQEQKETVMLSCVSRGKGRVVIDCEEA